MALFLKNDGDCCYTADPVKLYGAMDMLHSHIKTQAKVLNQPSSRRRAASKMGDFFSSPVKVERIRGSESPAKLRRN